jgi:chloramphenicol-sensitive protein RarD
VAGTAAGARQDRRHGLAFGLSAYLLWGLYPLYWPLLEPAGPMEILANRIVWSFAFLLAVLLLRRRWGWLRPLVRDRRRLLLLAAAAITVSLNWGVFIYGVNSGQVVQTSLGYFINPLVSVVFGAVLLGENLRRTQWMAVGLGALAVAVLSVDYGHLPWIALVLAFSFGTYGLVKKTLAMGSVDSLAVETALLFLPALGFLLWGLMGGQGTLATEGPAHASIMVTTGVVTAIPLLLFGAAATRVPLIWVGLMQYLAPVLQFVIGVAVYGEPMPTSRWVGFVLVWTALVVVVVDSLLSRGRFGREALTPAVE